MTALAAFTEEEKVRIRHHTGYPNAATVATMALGFPSSLETAYIVELAMTSLRAEAATQVRRHLAILDKIEEQMVEDLELLALESVEELTFRRDEQEKLESRYIYWADSLCNLLAIHRNPYDNRFATSAVNVRVQH